MTENQRQQTIDSWHSRADAYENLLQHHRIFTDMAMGLIEFVREHRHAQMRLMDLAAGTGLVSTLLLEHVHVSPSSLYLVEPAERMCAHARAKFPLAHVYQRAAEDCLDASDLPRDSFDFILSNASMHLMSEKEIYPIISQLLKPKEGYFLYTLWYHAFEETQAYDRNDQFEAYVDQALTEFQYPVYFSTRNSPSSSIVRSRGDLEETAHENGLKLHSCSIHLHQIPLSFDFDFMLMSPNWLMDHLQTYQWTQREEIDVVKARLIERIRELIGEKSTEKAIVQVIVSRASST